jgi:hypothetical protein
MQQHLPHPYHHIRPAALLQQRQIGILQLAAAPFLLSLSDAMRYHSYFFESCFSDPILS